MEYLTSHLPARLSARMTFSLANSFFSLTIPLANSFFGNSGSMNWAWIEFCGVGYIMLLVDFHGFPWIFVDFHGFSLIFVDFHGFSMDFR